VSQSKVQEKDKKVTEMETLLRSSRKDAKRVVRDISEVRRIFQHFDEDQSGQIEPAEFVHLLAKLLKQPVSEIDPTEVWRSWDMVDTDGSGTITFDEFAMWYCETFSVDTISDLTNFFSQDIIPETEKMIREVAKTLGQDNVRIEKIWNEFNKLDDDNSGSLEYAEFSRLMLNELKRGTTAADPPQKVLQKFWLDVDADNSGSVNFQEFAAWYLKFFHGDISPMEQYYHMLGKGYRRASFVALQEGNPRYQTR